MLLRPILTHNHWRRGHRSSFLEKKNSKKGLEKYMAKRFRKRIGKKGLERDWQKRFRKGISKKRFRK
jgi:hypothetical protein